jgi:hypothetical protein
MKEMRVSPYFVRLDDNHRAFKIETESHHNDDIALRIRLQGLFLLPPLCRLRFATAVPTLRSC